MNLNDLLFSPSEPEPKRSQPSNFHLTDIDRDRIKDRNELIAARLRQGDTSQAKIAEEFGVSQSTVFEVNRKLRGTDLPKFKKVRAKASKAGGNEMALLHAAENNLKQAKANVFIAEAELLEARAQLLRQSAKA